MMAILPPINFLKWIEENKEFLKPPVNNRLVYNNTEFIIMVVGGPNSRKDYHYNEGEEFFYQIKGDIIVKIQENGGVREVPIKEGEIFLLPPKIPHNPVRFKDTIGLVIERKRRADEKDGLLWFCEQCNNKLYEEYFQLSDITKQFQQIFQKFYNSLELRTCKQCGGVMQPPPIIA